MKPKVRPVCNGYWAKETLKTRENPISVQLNSQLQTRKEKLRNLLNSIHYHAHQIQQPISKPQLLNFHMFLKKQNRHSKLVLIGQFVGSKLVIGSGEQELEINVFFANRPIFYPVIWTVILLY